jgi:IBR domain, a half RING-finger domain
MDCRKSCHCEAGSSVQYCYHCIRTYIECHISENQATQLVCMTRECKLDDGFVRLRLSTACVSILDRNQVIEASRQTGHLTDETLWSCPTPDCSYVCFISTATSRGKSLRRPFGREMSGPDVRQIRCPQSLMSSCQVCSTVWSKGAVVHSGITCAAYAAKLVTANESRMLEKWKRRADVQPCRRCHVAIEKTAGCEHMRCRCGYQFCWICGQAWSRHSMTMCRLSRVAPMRLLRLVRRATAGNVSKRRRGVGSQCIG